MGNFRIEIDAVGGHGCKREVKDGGTVYGCGHMNCPDCRAREFVETLKRTSSSIIRATLTHWPDTASQVQDNLLTGERTGNF